MKISLNWLKTYINLDAFNPEQISEILTDIGLEVEGMQTVESVKGGLQGVVVGAVTECAKHPNADKLSVCKVETSDGSLQIVCGAPNVAAGQKVLVATIGTTLYDKEGSPWKIKEGKIRGEVSQGMICAEDELGLGSSHEGILVLEDEVALGTDAAAHFNVTSDIVYEIGLTPNRSDATSHLGVAKDLAAYLKINENHSGEVCVPQSAEFQEGTGAAFEVLVEDATACPRYSGVLVSNVEVKDAPDWIQNHLKSIDIRPVNNIVDITNFVLHEMGQPLHAFDAEKIAQNKIIVKTLPEGQTFTTLDEKERTLSEKDLMICDGSGKGMCMAGVFGGIGSGVTEKTTKIFLESAHFEAVAIRQTSTRHLLRTEAAKVFEKGSDPNVTMLALKRAAQLMVEYAGAVVSSKVIDVYPSPIEPRKIALSMEHLCRVIGQDITRAEAINILAAMGMECSETDASTLVVSVPTDKADVKRDVDLIEEVLRIYGFNKVTLPGKVTSSLAFQSKPDKHVWRNELSNLLASNGFSEMMALSLTSDKYFPEVINIEKDSLVYINNTSNMNLDVMRPTMLVSALETIQHNLNRQQNQLQLFEMGKTYQKAGDAFEETSHLSVSLTGQRDLERWNASKNGVGFHDLKAIIEVIFAKCGLGRFQMTELETATYSFGMRYHLGPKTLVEFGKISSEVTSRFDIKQDVYFADFYFDNLIAGRAKQQIHYKEISKFPGSRRDLALLVGEEVKYEDLRRTAMSTEKKILKEVDLFDVFRNEEMKTQQQKSYAVKFWFENTEQTLKDSEIDQAMTNLIKAFESKLGASIRK